MALSWWLKSRKDSSKFFVSGLRSDKRRDGTRLALETLEDRLTPTTAISFANNVLTINVGANNETARLSESGGNLTITSNDVGGTTADAGAQTLGFSVATAQNVGNTGSIASGKDVRLINITGAAGTQTVNLAGGNFTAMDIDDGLIENVSFQTAPSTFTDISGAGTSDVAAVPTSNLTIGESVTTPGAIVFGAGQATTEAPGATLTAVTLTLEGAGSYALDNVNDVGTLAAVTTGAIAFNNGTNTLTVGMVGSIAGITTTNSDVTITADSLILGQPITAGAGVVSLQPFTNTLPIQLGAASVAGTSYGLTDADLNQITAGSLQIGSATETGGIAVVNPISRHGFAELNLVTGNTTANAVTQTAPVSAADLDVQAAGGVELTNGANFVDGIAGSTGSGDFDFTDNANVSIIRLSPTDPTFGINANGNVTITVTAGNSTSGNITLSWSVAGATVTLTVAGSIAAGDTDAAAPLNKVTATDLVLSSSTGAGSAALPLSTTISNLVALNTTSGGIFLSNSGPLTIGFTGDPFQGVADEGSLDPISLASGPGDTFTLGSGTGEDVASDGGNITLSADTLVIANAITTGSASAGIVTLQQAGTTTRNIALGADPSPGNLGLSEADLNHVTANILRIGRTDNAGNIMPSGNISQPATVGSGLSLLTGGEIEAFQSAGSIAATNLRMEAATGIDHAVLQVSQLAASNSTSGLIEFTNSGDLTIGSVDGLAGITNDGGEVSILADGLTVSQPITATDFVFIQASFEGGAPININAPINGRAVEVTSGLSGSDITVTASGTSPLIIGGSGPAVVDLGNLQGPVSIGGSSITINSPAIASVLSVTATQVRWNNSEFVNYGATPLTINGGNASNVFNILGTGLGSPVTINTGAAASNIVNVGSASTVLASLLGPLTLNGQGASSTLNINDQGDTTGQTYNLASGTVSGAVAATYSGFASLTVIGGSGADIFNVAPSNTQFIIGGNSPTPPNFGDQLNMNSLTPGSTLLVSFDPASGFSGSWNFVGAQPVEFSGIESLTPAPAVITSPSAATFVTGQPGTFQFTTAGTPTTSITQGGALPDGVTFVDNGNGTATLFGVPATTGAFPLIITAVAGNGTFSSQSFTLTVNTRTAPSFSPISANLQFSSTQFAPNPGGNPTAALVQGFYNNILGRPGDAVEINQWVSALQSGVSSAQVVADFWNSTEHRQDEVNSYYQYYLGRTPTSADEQFWVTQLQSGESENNVVLQFLSSPEYSQLHVSNANFVGDLYLQILGRPADPAGLASFEASLDAGASRLDVAAEILFSSEANSLAINSYYLIALDRQGTTTDIEFWLQLANGGMPLGNIAQDFLASNEYAQNASGS